MSKGLYGEVAGRIQEIILQQCRGTARAPEDLSLDTPILGKGLGLDSLEALALSTKIEAEFDILIDDEDLTVSLFETIGTLAEHVKKLLRNTEDGAAG